MGRGTTKTHFFKLPFTSKAIKKARVVYTQNNNIVLKKEVEQEQLEDNTVVVKLSQEDTFKLIANTPVEIQLRLLFVNGDVKNSDIIRTSVSKCLDNEVLV